jgi:hypothetical protein
MQGFAYRLGVLSFIIDWLSTAFTIAAGTFFPSVFEWRGIHGAPG